MLRIPFEPAGHQFVFSNAEMEREARRRDRKRAVSRWKLIAES